jgi:hypothetical protein
VADWFRTVTVPPEVYNKIAASHARKPCCENCGSEDVIAFDCTGYINGSTGRWELSDLSDNEVKCQNCDHASSVFSMPEHVGPFYIEPAGIPSKLTAASYILEKKFTRDDLPGIVSVIEAIIEKFEHYVMPQGGGEDVDRAWDEINTAMAFLCEELGIERPD